MKNNTLSQSLKKTTTKLVLALTILFSFISFSGYSTHIVGGELNYKCLGGNLYEIRLRVYRDCYTGVPPFDNPAAVGIFGSNNVLIQTIFLNFPGSTVLPPTLAQANPCIKTPTNICVEVAEYVGTVTLPPRAGGYQLAYQRCCRNPTIDNLTNPGNQGATYYAVIPDQTVAACNSNPVFKNWPPIFVCANSPIVFDHSATDADGDSIHYEMCTPFTGATSGNAQPNPPANPPYAFVTWRAPYTANDPLGGIPLNINPTTGLLVGIPNTVGQFVVGVCANEYRNGVLVSTTKRDFQFNVVACQPDVVASFASFTSDCNNHTVIFTNNSVGTTSFDWNFGDLTTTADVSTLTNPTYTYPGAGTYTVRLIAFHATNPLCNDTLDFMVTVDTCKPCGMTLGITKVDATCGISGCTTVPPVLDTQNGRTISSGTSNTTITWNHTVTAGGLNRLLIVQLSSITFNATSVTCGGIPLTLLTQSTNGIFRAEMWYLLSPPTGVNSIVADYGPGSGTFFSEKRGESFSFTGVNQTVPFNTPTTTTGNTGCPASFTIASGTDELVIDMIVKDYFYPPTVDNTLSPTQNQQYSRQITFNPSVAGSLQPGILPSVTSNWEWTFCGTYPWAAVGVSMKPACAGGPTPGSATVTSSGGTAPYNYSWNTTPVQTTPTANNLPAGTYIVSVIDAANCFQTASVIIDANSTIVLTPSSTPPTTCGSADGTASVTATGGTGPLTYLWTPGNQTTPTITGLTAGTYMVNVVDSAGCTKSTSITIGQPTTITVTASKTDVKCKGGSTGTAIANPTGGSGTYTYSWSTNPVQTTPTAVGLVAGYYTVIATDANGCSGSASVTVLDSSLVLTSSSTDVLCAGGNSGTASITATGGTPTYTYLWNTSPVQTTPTATGLVAGTYDGIVTDNAGCKDTVSFTITEPPLLDPEAQNTSTVACAGTTSGSADVFVSGGTSPFTYLWCNGQTGPTATGLVQGYCTVTVTDSNGCVATDSVNIVYPAPLSLTYVSSNVLCAGDNNGSATVNPVGGLPGYTYSWSTVPVQNTQTATGLGVGTYAVVVTDNLGCTASVGGIVISQPPPLVVTKSGTDVTCPGANDGTATVSVSGGTPGYNYSWINTSPVQTTPTATGLTGGTFISYITDANGCDTTVSVLVLDVNPSPVAYFTIANNLTCDGMVTSFSNASTSATSYLWIFGDGTTSTEKDPEHTFVYGTSTKVLLIVKNGICSDTMSLDINVNSFADYITPYIPNVFTPNGDMNNDQFAISVGNGLEYCVKITIYDRWGLKMYDNFNGAPWDGRTKSGKAVPDGTYFYLLEIGENDPKEGITPYQMHGVLTLLR